MHHRSPTCKFFVGHANLGHASQCQAMVRGSKICIQPQSITRLLIICISSNRWKLTPIRETGHGRVCSWSGAVVGVALCLGTHKADSMQFVGPRMSQRAKTFKTSEWQAWPFPKLHSGTRLFFLVILHIDKR